MSSYIYRFRIGGYQHPLLFDLSLRNHCVDISFEHEEDLGGGNHFFFSSRHLDELSQPAHIWGRAKQLLDLFHGIYSLATLARNAPFETAKPTLSDLYDLRTGHSMLLEYADPPTFLPYTQSVLDIEVHNAYKNHPIGISMLLSRTQPDVYTLLSQLGQDLDWRTLYAISDSLQHFDIDSKARMRQAGISKNLFKQFTHTANNFTALGLQARHGASNDSAPAVPMTLPEAKYLIKSWSRQYLKDIHSVKFNEPIEYKKTDSNTLIDEDF